MNLNNRIEGKSCTIPFIWPAQMYVFFFNFDPLVILKLSITGKID
jgi:hypothetical protein